MLGLILVSLGLAFVVFECIFKNKPTNLPNGSMGWPLVGETLAFLKPHRSNFMGSFLQHHCSKYGKVFKSHLFGSPAIVSCDHELNMFILQNEEKLFVNDNPKVMHGILGNLSLLSTSGHLHKKLRNVAVSFIALSKSNPAFFNSLQNLTLSTMESWKQSNEIYFHNEIKKFIFTIMLKNFLSIEAEEPVAMRIFQDFSSFLRGFISLPLAFPGSPYNKAVKARGRLTCIIRDVLKEREMENNKKEDFLDLIMSKGNLTEEESVSIVLDILLGGHETTAAAISLVLYFLAHSPPDYLNLKKEHEDIRKGKEGKLLNWEDYKKMEFTQNVISEALRCGNIVKFVHRKALQDIKFKDYLIPSGWKVLPIFAGVHFDPSLHQNPYHFNPSRWLNKATRKKVMPFSGGGRLCPGAELAKVEIAFFLHYFVLSYKWKIKAEDDYPLAYPFVEFKGGLLLKLEPVE